MSSPPPSAPTIEGVAWTASQPDFGRCGAAFLTPALLGVVAGASLQLQQPELWSALAYCMCAAAGVALWFCARWRRGTFASPDGLQRKAVAAHAVVLVVVCLAAALVVFALGGLRSVRYAQGALDPALEGKNLVVTGTVASLPQSVEQGVRFVLRVETAQAAGELIDLPGSIDLGWYLDGWGDRSLTPPPPEKITPHAGERWRMTVRLKAPNGARNPNGFDYELRLWEQGVRATGYVRLGTKDEPPKRLSAAQPLGAYAVLRLRERVRDAILQQLAGEPEGDARISESARPGTPTARTRAAGVVAALVTGDQRVIDQADWDVFRATGVSHLVSISGLHITLFAWLASQLIGMLWRRVPRWCLALPAPSAALLGGLALATLYALFSGWGVPAQRTVLMLAVVVLLRLIGRRWPWPHVWLLACAAVVLLDPWALLQAGFWLSFVAVGVLFAMVPIANNQVGISARDHFLSLIRQQAVITVALAPLTLLLFGQVSVVGFVANLLAIPWVTMVVTPLSFAGVLWAPFWQLSAWAVQAIGWWLGWLAALPIAQVSVASAPLWAGLAAVIGGIALAARLPWSLRLIGLPLCLPVLLWQAPRPLPGHFELLAADVGQGNAVLVRTAGHSLLYDTGPRYSAASDAGERVLVPLLRSLGETLDVVMISHRDSDHSGGAAAVLTHQPQARLTGSIPSEASLLAMRDWTPCVSGQRWTWDGVQFDVLHPPVPASPKMARGERPNAQSCVLKIRASDQTTALLVGDIEKAQERSLVERAAVSGETLAATLLLVPHHGSKTSSSDVFLDAVQPRTALVQAAYRSRFGHPAPEVVQRYRARGTQIIDSARCGAATWQSSEPARVRCERIEDRRYWQHGFP